MLRFLDCNKNIFFLEENYEKTLTNYFIVMLFLDCRNDVRFYGRYFI